MIIKPQQAQKLLRHGECIAVPTDTIYGLAADMYNERAILNVYNLKKRDLKKPFVIQLSSCAQLYEFLHSVPFDLEKVVQHFWPGALTLVLPVKTDLVSGIIRSNLPTAAFRVAANRSIRNLIQSYGPLVVTSANYSNQKELLSAEEIEDSFGQDFPILENEEPYSDGKASTVLAYVDSMWVILRVGAIYLKELRSVLGYNPPVVSQLDFANQSYSINTQLHCMEKPYDGSIKTVLSFSDIDYLGAEKVIRFGPITSSKGIKMAMIQLTKLIEEDNPPHVWVDLNFAKDELMQEVASMLKRAQLN